MITGGSLRGIVVMVVRFAVVIVVIGAFTSPGEVVFTSGILNVEVFGPRRGGTTGPMPMGRTTILHVIFLWCI